MYRNFCAGGLEGADREVEVEPFSIARYPVTWLQYRAFLDAEDGYDNGRWWRKDLEKAQEKTELLWNFDNYPAINVSWYDAVAFCRWLSHRRQAEFRLPKEWEWQWAAMAGKTEYVYPWGPEWRGSRANTVESNINRTIAVGLYPLGDAVLGDHLRVADLSGNVWEWCLDEYDKLESTEIHRGDSPRVVRGGSWGSSRDDARAAVRFGFVPAYCDDQGFRLCCSFPIE